MVYDPADGIESWGAPGNVFYFVRDLDGSTTWYTARLGVEPAVHAHQLVMFDLGASG